MFHAGDGNLHPLILFDCRDEEETARVREAGTKILRLCVDAGGTISGEHGIGLEKLHEMSFIFSQDDIAAMWKLKNAFDPVGGFNPGKVTASTRFVRAKRKTENGHKVAAWYP